MHTKKVVFLNQKKEKLTGVLHLPSQKTNKAVIVCHGFGSNKDALWIPRLCNTLAKEHYATLRFDFSGNGQSEGKFSEANCEKEKKDLRSALNFLKKKGYNSFATIGHSMGGTVVLTNPAKADALVAIAAAIHTKKVENRLLTTKEKKELHNEGRVRIHLGNTHYTLTKNFFTAFEKQKVLRCINKIKTPLLLIHGSEDHTIPIEESKTVKKRNPHTKLTVIEGGTHTLMKGKSTKILIKTITDWLKNNY